MAGPSEFDPIQAQAKIEQALAILEALGIPRAQQNERSALTLLALIGLAPEGSWQMPANPMIGITPIMSFCRDVYKKAYALSSREHFRRYTMHQFVEAGIAVYNPDQPDRPVNSPKACYQIAPEVTDVIQTFGQPEWDDKLESYLAQRVTLAEKYAKRRKMTKIPVQISENHMLELSPGKHSRLIGDIIGEFAPRFVPGSEVIYIGDTGGKTGFLRQERLQSLGIDLYHHGKLPDVVLFSEEKGWLV